MFSCMAMLSRPLAMMEMMPLSSSSCCVLILFSLIIESRSFKNALVLPFPFLQAMTDVRVSKTISPLNNFISSGYKKGVRPFRALLNPWLPPSDLTHSKLGTVHAISVNLPTACSRALNFLAVFWVEEQELIVHIQKYRTETPWF